MGIAKAVCSRDPDSGQSGVCTKQVSGKEIVSLNHEAFDRSLYSEGALFAAEWLIKKKPGLYSMRNVLNFK